MRWPFAVTLIQIADMIPSTMFLLLVFSSLSRCMGVLEQARLTSPLDQWMYESTEASLEHVPVFPRFWDRDSLFAAETATNYAQLGPVLRKLRSGQPITVGESTTFLHQTYDQGSIINLMRSRDVKEQGCCSDLSEI